jgi:hypothetical protein
MKMTYSEAAALNAKGELTRKVMTEQGWYVPTDLREERQFDQTDVSHETPVKRRGRPKKVQS